MIKTNSFQSLLAVLLWAGISLYGCGNVNEEAASSLFPHPAGWVVASGGSLHPAAYQANPTVCDECHGSSVDAGLSGGISGVSCFSAARNNITCHPDGPAGHPDGWAAPASHGAAAKAVPGLTNCKPCHGESFNTLRDGSSCVSCHGVAAPHPAKPWFGITYTHSNTDAVNASVCAACHTARNNLSATGLARLPAIPVAGSTGCYNNTLCHGIMGHSTDPQPWDAAANHGARAKLNPGSGNGFSTCQQCHGTAFSTDRGGNSCVSCHGVAAPHPAANNWRSIAAITHTNTGVNNAAVCSNCHTSAAANLALPYSAWFANSPAGSFKVGTPDCFTASLCHGDVRKTSNCDACHSIATTAPFKSLGGATATSDAKVGAHVKHLSAAVLSANVPCAECHTVPASPATAGTHRNLTNNLAFGTLAKTGSLTPTYTAATGVCANTYCHGTTLTGGGSNKAPIWNQSNYLSGCGTCHGFPPSSARNGAASHTVSTACNGCHTGVNSSNNGFTVSGLSLHINGSVEAPSGGHDGAPYPGSAHRNVSIADCFGCHPANVAGSTYPASPGTPPNCRGCHLNANPSTGSHCNDCHGDPTTGRPNGSTFPNRAGQHQLLPEHNFSCTACHPFTTGNSQHGWSGGLKSTAARVNVNINPTTPLGWNSTNKTCANVCHGSQSWY